jgi:hypothetical protein
MFIPQHFTLGAYWIEKSAIITFNFFSGSNQNGQKTIKKFWLTYNNHLIAIDCDVSIGKNGFKISFPVNLNWLFDWIGKLFMVGYSLYKRDLTGYFDTKASKVVGL